MSELSQTDINKEMGMIFFKHQARQQSLKYDTCITSSLNKVEFHQMKTDKG